MKAKHDSSFWQLVKIANDLQFDGGVRQSRENVAAWLRMEYPECRHYADEVLEAAWPTGVTVPAFTRLAFFCLRPAQVAGCCFGEVEMEIIQGKHDAQMKEIRFLRRR